jgi:hypothetical protein
MLAGKPKSSPPREAERKGKYATVEQTAVAQFRIALGVREKRYP